MKHIVILICILGFGTMQVFSQNQKFLVFARQSDSLMRVALHENNTQKYLSTFNNLLTQYNELNKEDQLDFKPLIFGSYYNLSCLYSLLNNKKEAIANLKKAIDFGYHNYQHIQSDSDLDNIRKEQDFLTVIKPLRETGDYLYILKKDAKYNLNDKREIAKFTYPPQSDPDLVKIRKDFKLDSIIGRGNEISQIINLLHWVHNSFPHDGTKDAPKSNSIYNLMEICKKERKTMDCGSLAIVMNTCYAALGFKSRRVICLPKDSTDYDCHSITTVFYRSKNKWIWIDPTFEAYVMNESGELLSIAEVRERIINGQPLILNPDANWNHVESQTKENYLYGYMAKNLYAILCQTVVKGIHKSNLLLPVDYKSVIPRVRQNNPYCTNNPGLFWEKPE